jgi:iron(III) transport system substrate-binding protein
MLTRRHMLAVLAAGAAGASSAAADARVIVYSANDANLNRFVFEAFTRETGIAVDGVEAGSGVLFRRVASEKDHPLGDAIWGVNRSLLQANKALLAPYAAKYRDAVPAQYRDPDDHWIGTNLHLLVILQNTKLVTAADAPKSWTDLLAPQWKDRIAFTDPANSGSAYANVTMLAQAWGPGEAGWERVAKLLANTKVLNRSTLVFQGVGNGEFPLGMSLEYAGLQWAGDGAPVRVIYPLDGTSAQMEGVAVIRGGPNPEGAKAFVDFVSRKDVREMILGKFFRRPARQDLDLSHLPGAMPQLSALKLLDYDEDLWTEKRAETSAKIQDIIRRTR